MLVAKKLDRLQQISSISLIILFLPKLSLTLFHPFSFSLSFSLSPSISLFLSFPFYLLSYSLSPFLTLQCSTLLTFFASNLLLISLFISQCLLLLLTPGTNLDFILFEEYHGKVLLSHQKWLTLTRLSFFVFDAFVLSENW